MDKDIKFQPQNNVLFIWDKVITLVGLIIGLWLMTQTFAKYLNYADILGHPLLVIGDMKIYSPFHCLYWMIIFINDNRIGDIYFKSGIPLVVSVTVSMAIAFVVSLKRGANKIQGVFGDSRFMDVLEMEQKGLFANNGVVLGQEYSAVIKKTTVGQKTLYSTEKIGRVIVEASDTHIMVLGNTRTFKGVSIVIPTLLAYPGSIFVFDIKGENYSITAGYRETFSHIIRYAPMDPESMSFNILEYVRPGVKAYDDATTIAESLVKTDGDGSSDAGKHFTEQAQYLLTAVILYVLASPDIYDKNLYGCYKVVTMPSEIIIINNYPVEDKKTFLKKMAEGNYVDANIKGKVQSICSVIDKMGDKEFGSVVSSLVKSLKIYDDDVVRHNIKRNDFSIDQFISSEKPITLYVTVPLSHVEKLSPLIKSMVIFITKRMSEGETSYYKKSENKNELLFLLDEAAQFGRFPFMENSLGIMAGYGVKYLLIYQNIKQILRAYNGIDPISDHCKTKIMYTTSDVKDAEALSRALGKKSAWKGQFAASGKRNDAVMDNINKGGSEVAIDLMSPGDIMKLPADEAIITIQGEKPIRAKKIFYYDDPRFEKKVNLPVLKDRERTIWEMGESEMKDFWYKEMSQWLEEESYRNIGQQTEIEEKPEEKDFIL